MPISDDWSYIRSADVLARTGHIVYNGWATAMIGWQLYLGAAFIRMFGFSFTAPRITTLILACLTVFLIHRTFVRLGIDTYNASLGTLILALSPLFMMLSATFLTDIPGLLALILSLYACIRSLQTSSDRSATLWIVLAVLSNCICGSSRQIAWLGVLVIVPSTLLLLRSRRRVLLTGITCTLLGYVFVFACMRWFPRQPNVIAEPFTLPHSGLANLAHILVQYNVSLLEATLLLIPVTALFLAEVRHWSRRSFALAAALVVAAVPLLLFMRRSMPVKNILDPLSGDWVGIHGNYNGLNLIAQNPPQLTNYPVLIGHSMHRLLAVITLATLLCVIVTLLSSRRPHLRSKLTASLSGKPLFWLLCPLSMAYAGLLVDRAEQQIYDRYLLLPLFLLLYVLLRFYQNRIQPSLPYASIAILVPLAAFGMICTHNLFALDRARVAIGKEVLAAGVPANFIDFGWEQNGWIALQSDPAVNDSRSNSHTYLPIYDPHLPVCYGQSVIFGMYPRLAPRYGITFDPNACAGLADFPPVSYSAWPSLKPSHLYVVKYPPPWHPESYYIAAPQIPAR